MNCAQYILSFTFFSYPIESCIDKYIQSKVHVIALVETVIDLWTACKCPE